MNLSEQFDKKNATRFDLNNNIDNLTFVLEKLAEDNKNVYLDLSNGKRLYAMDYKNLTPTEIKQQVYNTLYAKSAEEVKAIRESLAKKQEQLDKKSQRVSKLFDEIYSQGEGMIYSSKLPEWRATIAKYFEMDDIKVVVDALAVMNDLESGNMDMARRTLNHLAGSKERAKEIEDIVASFSKIGPEFLQEKCIGDLSEKDIIKTEILKMHNQSYAKLDEEPFQHK
ncbi:MAG: hypothetical protein ACI4L7_02415 [Christensenellales bacterium]